MATVLHSSKECIKTNLISLEEFLTLWKVHYSTLSKSSTKGNKASSRNKTIFGITQWTLADRSGHLSWYHTMNPKGRKKTRDHNWHTKEQSGNDWPTYSHLQALAYGLFSLFPKSNHIFPKLMHSLYPIHNSWIE